MRDFNDKVDNLSEDDIKIQAATDGLADLLQYLQFFSRKIERLPYRIDRIVSCQGFLQKPLIIGLTARLGC